MTFHQPLINSHIHLKQIISQAQETIKQARAVISTISYKPHHQYKLKFSKTEYPSPALCYF